MGGGPETLANISSMGLYWGTNPAIACGTGADTDVFIREPGNILYEPTDAGKQYKTWYSGYTAAGDDQKMHYAYSSDGKTWTKAGAVISDRLEDPYVVKAGGIYYLYAEDYAGNGVGRYQSANLIDWSYDGLVLSNAQSPIVWLEGDTWYMIYERYPANKDIALATSADGLTWTPSGSNPVFELSDATWTDGSIVDVVPDDIIKSNGTYYLTYHAYLASEAHTGIATSTDLVNWIDQQNNPIDPYLTLGVTNSPSAQYIYNGSSLVFLYQARGTSQGDDVGLRYAYPLRVAP